jgi:very-short-patch-repair endonuclease
MTLRGIGNDRGPVGVRRHGSRSPRPQPELLAQLWCERIDHHEVMPRRVLSSPDPRLLALLERADQQGGVVSRQQIYAAGLSRWHVKGQLRARRWGALSDQAICVHTGEPSDHGLRWAAVIQGGPRAHLDGVSALIEAGLERFTEDRIRVTVPRGARVRRSGRFNIRQTRRWDALDADAAGIPRSRPAVAAVRGALWAVSDRQATLLLTMTVQQGIARAEEIGTALLRIRRDKRRLLLHLVVLDLMDGAGSLGELDVVRLLRRRGLPKPDRQMLRRDGKKRYYLDLYWERWGLVVEIDGIQHAWAENLVHDALRQNSLTLDGDVVLRIPLLGLRLVPDEFLDQIEEALAARGWARAA